jgi:hypothetical protein
MGPHVCIPVLVEAHIPPELSQGSFSCTQNFNEFLGVLLVQAPQK